MGNVVAACVVLDYNRIPNGLDDSKKLSEKKRAMLEVAIKEQALAYGIGMCTPLEIDRLNILNASLLAMRRAYESMHLACNLMLVDGNKIPSNLNIKAYSYLLALSCISSSTVYTEFFILKLLFLSIL